MNMGARIKAEREGKGWEQRDLVAKVPGLTQQNLSNLEKRDSKTSEFAVGIADALGVSLRWLLSGEGDRRADWPFRHITREQLAALSAEDLPYVEGQLKHAIDMLHSPIMPARQAVEQARLDALTRNAPAPAAAPAKQSTPTAKRPRHRS